MEYVSFYIEKDLYAIPLFLVQEISRMVDIYPVPGHDSRIEGVVSLRGRISVVVNLPACLKIKRTENSFKFRHKLIILENKEWITENYRHLSDQVFEEQVVLMVDDVFKITDDEKQELFEPPAHVHEKYVQGIMKVDSTLITLLSVNKLIEDLMPQEESV